MEAVKNYKWNPMSDIRIRLKKCATDLTFSLCFPLVKSFKQSYVTLLYTKFLEKFDLPDDFSMTSVRVF